MPKSPMQLIAFLVWRCVSGAPVTLKHPFYDLRLISEDSVLEFLQIASLNFAPGAFTVLRAATPPYIDLFKGLRVNAGKRWAVYVLVLEKVGYRPKVYIGSGTKATDRISDRSNQHDR
jgi:hypothetical protein